MTVRQGLLALLSEGDKYGAQLRAEFEGRTGGSWPLNVGQVYTTLARLERDGLVSAGDPDGEGRIRYGLTEGGRADLAAWWVTPVPRSETPREELVFKLALAVTIPGIDVAHIIQAQRRATMSRMQELTRLKQSIDPRDVLSWSLILENQLFLTEAELRWLDHVEATIARHGRPASPGGVPVAVEDDARVGLR